MNAIYDSACREDGHLTAAGQALLPHAEQLLDLSATAPAAVETAVAAEARSRS